MPAIQALNYSAVLFGAWGSSEQVMPRATVLFRDEILGAGPKASLDGLPGLATTEIARQSAVPSGSDKNGPFAHQVPGRCIQHRLRNVGDQIIPFLSRARVAALIQSFPRARASRRPAPGSAPPPRPVGRTGPGPRRGAHSGP